MGEKKRKGKEARDQRGRDTERKNESNVLETTRDYCLYQCLKKKINNGSTLNLRGFALFTRKQCKRDQELKDTLNLKQNNLLIV